MLQYKLHVFCFPFFCTFTRKNFWVLTRLNEMRPYWLNCAVAYAPLKHRNYISSNWDVLNCIELRWKWKQCRHFENEEGPIASVGTAMSAHCIHLLPNKFTRTPNFPVKNSKSLSIFPDKRTLLFFMHVQLFFFKSVFLESVRQGKILRVKETGTYPVVWRKNELFC